MCIKLFKQQITPLDWTIVWNKLGEILVKPARLGLRPFSTPPPLNRPTPLLQSRLGLQPSSTPPRPQPSYSSNTIPARPTAFRCPALPTFLLPKHNPGSACRLFLPSPATPLHSCILSAWPAVFPYPPSRGSACGLSYPTLPTFLLTKHSPARPSVSPLPT